MIQIYLYLLFKKDLNFPPDLSSCQHNKKKLTAPHTEWFNISDRLFVQHFPDTSS